jgi:hypothetical protein
VRDWSSDVCSSDLAGSNLIPNKARCGAKILRKLLYRARLGYDWVFRC